MALCVLDTKKNILHYAGANNPLYLVRNRELQVISPDYQPVAIFIKETGFTHHKIEVQKDDCIYVFSDGYVDQFGGKHGEKFKSKRFKELLLEINEQPMSQQKVIMEKILERWMHEKYDQLDDILVMGIRI